MAKFNVDYDSGEDILYLYSGIKAKESLEVEEDIVIDISDGKLTGIEIFYASQLLSNLNKKINKKVLSSVKNIGVEMKKYRNLIMITLVFKVGKEVIREKLPAFSSSKYESPLIASVA